MLEYTPSKRISAEAALNDIWITSLGKKSAAEPVQIKQSLGNLQSFKVCGEDLEPDNNRHRRRCNRW